LQTTAGVASAAAAAHADMRLCKQPVSAPEKETLPTGGAQKGGLQQQKRHQQVALPCVRV